MLPVPLGGLAAQEGAAIFVFFGAQILKKIQNGHNTNHGFVADFTQSPIFGDLTTREKRIPVSF
jgi:hypothetical protein